MELNQSITASGKRFNPSQLRQVIETVATFQNLSRTELAYTICQNLNWTSPSGALKLEAGIVALEKFEKLGLISLPKKLEYAKHEKKSLALTEASRAPIPTIESLANLMPLELVRVTTKGDRDLWNEFVERYHYLGYKRPFGAHLRYFIVSKAKNDLPLGCLLFSSSAWSLSPRDLWIGWRVKDRMKRLNLVLNNSRFLIFPWIKVESLASKVLSMAAKQVPKDWEEVYAYRPVLFETFVDPAFFEGTCYQAANWEQIGVTQGRSRMDRFGKKEVSVKKVFVLPLVSNFREFLRGKVHPLKKTKPTELLDQSLKDASEHPLWQKIVLALNDLCTRFDNSWQKRKRVIDTLFLVIIIFRLVLSKNMQGYSITLFEIWKNQNDLRM